MPDWVTTILLGILASGGLWAMVQELYRNRKGARMDTLLRQNEMLIEQNEKRDIRDAAISAGMVGLLHEKLFDATEHYRKAGHISEARYQYLKKHIFEPYKELGGNDNAEELMEELKSLIDDR